MKIRSGFVSNSSSSSFVIVGDYIKESELTDMGWWDDEDGGETDKVPEGIKIYYAEDDRGYLVGKPLCECDDTIGDGEYDNKEVTTIFNETKKILKRPVKLIMGTRMC